MNNEKAICPAIHNDTALQGCTVRRDENYKFLKTLSSIYSQLNVTNGLALLLWRFLLTDGDPG